MRTEAELIVESGDRIMEITINRPAAHNAMTLDVAIAIDAALDELDARQDLSVGIITGAGTTFCSGMDLQRFLSGERPITATRGFAGLVQRPPRKPLIAAVEGFAVAGGCEIALACDLIVAADNAKFGMPEVKRGLAANAGGLIRLPRRVPYHFAMEMALTGELITAERAAQVGLVSRLTEPRGAMAGARALAASIAANGPLAVSASKQIVSESGGWSDEEAFDRQYAINEPVRTSNDAREGARAFVEKRLPKWTGS